MPEATATPDPLDLRPILFRSETTAEDAREWFLDIAALLGASARHAPLRSWREFADAVTGGIFPHVTEATPENVRHTLELCGFDLDAALPAPVEVDHA